MTIYHERLWASPWVFISTALVIPASILVFLPINQLAGPVVGIGLYAAVLVLIAVGSPTIEVTETTLTAGRARLPLGLIGSVAGFRDELATEQRGTKLDARAWLLIRGWVTSVVRIDLNDPDDPTPYWIVSTRNPEQLVEALDSARSRVGS
ncbi:MAG: rane protein [Microbacteriaceae bacterium]|jgi:hypothetical protein|nr:rane protein [Microbacteriaceae bacterium]